MTRERAQALATFRETLALHKANRNGPGLYASDKVFALDDALDAERARADRAEAELEAVKADLDRTTEKILPLDEALTKALAELERVKREAVEALEFYASPAIYAPHPHGPAFDRRDISFRAKSTLAAICGDDELPPNYAACCSSTNLAACDCVNKRHIRVLFAKGGRMYQSTGGRL